MRKHPLRKYARKNPDRIPSGISEYIKINFKNGFLSDINSSKDRSGKRIHMVDIRHDNHLYHMKFDSNGNLLSRVSEPMVEMYDEGNYVEID